ncbi:hypothetical protein ASD05_11605 [Variovorax sp. Root434]|nr:hypothetical protein ASD05_11605 [Variovorax sp. Root434]
MVTLPLHAKHTTEPVEYGTDPAPILIATDDVECADLPGRRIQFVDKGQHPLLMRHRDQHAGEIPQRSCAGDEGREVIVFDHKRDAYRVCALFEKEPVQ